jgi:hypothetical protein
VVRKYYSQKSLSNIFCEVFLKGLFPEQRKQQSQEDTDENGGNNGKVKSKILLSDDDISGKSPDPWNLLPDHQKDPDEDNKNSQEDEHLT